MSQINHMTVYSEEICPQCHKKFLVNEKDQVPGFRDRETLRCPYCHTDIRSSMEVEWDTYTIPEEEDAQ